MAKRKMPKNTKTPRIKRSEPQGDLESSEIENAEDASNPSKPLKTKEQIQKEEEQRRERQKSLEQYQKDKKDPEGRRVREVELLKTYIQKHSKGGELVITLDEVNKLMKKMWSGFTSDLWKMMKELGWENDQNPKNQRDGILFIQKKNKS